jgi:SAM-dependent methyltransferase
VTAPREAAAPATAEEAIWQDVEFGPYAADLPLWLELARAAQGPVLELGAGAGRVTLHLAERKLEVIALERDRDLIRELGRRAERRNVSPGLLEADLAAPAGLRLPNDVALVIAPLHVIQSVDPAQRVPLLAALRAALPSGALLAVSLVDESTLLAAGAAASQIMPQMREVEGWVYSSEPLWVQATATELRVRRLRQRVSPEGALDRTVHDDLLHRLSPERLELEGEETGYRPAGRRAIQSGPDEADSVVVLLEAT